MTWTMILRAGVLCAIALIGVAIPGDAVAHIATEAGAPALAFFDELLIAGALVGMLVLLDTTSWPMMTSRR